MGAPPEDIQAQDEHGLTVLNYFDKVQGKYYVSPNDVLPGSF